VGCNHYSDIDIQHGYYDNKQYEIKSDLEEIKIKRRRG